MLQNDPHIFIALYRHIARQWISKSCFTHVITHLSMHTHIQQALYELGFGLLVIDALRPVTSLPVANINLNSPEKILIRSLERGDFSQIQELDFHLNQHLTDSPIFLKSKSSSPTELRQEFYVKHTKTVLALSQDKGDIVGAVRGVMGSGNELLTRDANTLYINFAYTRPQYRGLGIAHALLNEIIAWGKDKQAKRCTVDFESQNLEAKRFWLRYFSPIFYSSMRKVDPRIYDHFK